MQQMVYDGDVGVALSYVSCLVHDVINCFHKSLHGLGRLILPNMVVLLINNSTGL